MKPTQEQVIALAYEVGLLEHTVDDTNEYVEALIGYIEGVSALAYEAGRKDENEACAGFLVDYANRFDDIRCAALEVAAEYIRARREQ